MSGDVRWLGGLVEDGDEPVVRLVRWTGPWQDDDPDANVKQDVAAYAGISPLATATALARHLDVPVGALVRYILARWASGGSEALLELGPSTVDRLRAEFAAAESAATDQARLRAYEAVRQQVEWLAAGLDDPENTYPSGGGDAPRDG